MGMDAAVNFYVSAILFRVARATESIALEADGWHLRTHVYTSLGVFVGLGFIVITNRHEWDPVAAIIVAMIITRAGWHILHDAWRHLADTALPPEERKVISDIMTVHEGEIVSFHKLRTRRSGPYRQIDLHLVVSKGMSVENAHILCDHLEEHIKEHLPRTEVVIHVEPE
jgi:cation diffusion facilitator family transporter